MLPTVALVGRPNVGKSTLFNKIAGKKISIIEDIPGITRDRIYQKVTYERYTFNLIDTGGIDLAEEKFNKEIKMQAEIAIDQADVIVFVVDGKEGLTENDYEVRNLLRKTNKKVIVAINKIDVKEAKNNIYDFYELGFDTYIPISAIHNTGYNDLLDMICMDFNKNEDETEDTRLKFSIIGRINVKAEKEEEKQQKALAEIEKGYTQMIRDIAIKTNGNPEQMFTKLEGFATNPTKEVQQMFLEIYGFDTTILLVALAYAFPNKYGHLGIDMTNFADIASACLAQKLQKDMRNIQMFENPELSEKENEALFNKNGGMDITWLNYFQKV